MAENEIPDHVKQQAYDISAPTRENIAQVEQIGVTAPADKQGQLSPEIEDRLNSPVRDSYEEFNRNREMEQPGPDSGFGPGKS